MTLCTWCEQPVPTAVRPNAPVNDYLPKYHPKCRSEYIKTMKELGVLLARA